MTQRKKGQEYTREWMNNSQFSFETKTLLILSLRSLASEKKNVHNSLDTLKQQILEILTLLYTSREILNSESASSAYSLILILQTVCQ
jgi:hypothetical protein